MRNIVPNVAYAGSGHEVKTVYEPITFQDGFATTWSTWLTKGMASVLVLWLLFRILWDRAPRFGALALDNPSHAELDRGGDLLSLFLGHPDQVRHNDLIDR